MARKRKSRIRSAGKVESKDILGNAQWHLEDPDLAQVECAGSHFFCPVVRLNRALADVHARREDEAYLQRRSKSGRGLAKAYAGTLLLAQGDGELPYVAQAKLPFGTYPYAMRGTAAAHHYLGLQHWDDPRLRLLAFSDLVKKRRFRFFAVGDTVVCAHRRGPVPNEYVVQEAERLGLVARDGVWTCPHPEATPAVALDWRAAGTRVRVCGACGGTRNSAHALLERAAVPRPGGTFAARAALPQVRGAPPVEAHDAEAEQRYLTGAIGDAAFLEAAAAKRRAAYAAMRGPLFVAGDVAYTDAASFVAALAPKGDERTALEAALRDVPGALVLDRPSAARALEALWDARGRAALEAVGGPEGAALWRPVTSSEAVADLVRRAAEVGTRRRADEGMPRYARLPPAARVADAAARALRRGERDAALRALDGAEPGQPRAVALAVRRRVGGAESHLWKYAKEEVELAAQLEEAVAALLAAGPKEYHERLAALDRAAGGMEEFRPA